MVSRVAGGPIEWEDRDPGQRWDVVSTGCAGDLAELIGHLWLVGRTLDGGHEVAVPKVAGRQACVGFADVLESGEYPFASDGESVRRECALEGSSVARLEGMVPNLDALLKRRRVVSAMRNDGLTHLSIMAGLVAAGCTHAVVDVKELAGEGVGGCLRGDVKRRLESFPQETGVREEMREGSGGLVQTVKGLGSLREVRWCSTNGDCPQGRAMGGLLTLLHVDGLIRGSYGNGRGESLLFDRGKRSDNQYARFYCESLADLCDVPAELRSRGTLERAWGRLRRRMKFGRIPGLLVRVGRSSRARRGGWPNSRGRTRSVRMI